MLNNRLVSLSAQIEKMTPQQRQQFAMQHKTDPIIVSLTKFVNDQEKALRQAMTPVDPAALNPPKVVDQEIEQMVPQPQPAPAGVGALPAPNLAGMPDGGITGESVPQQPPMSMKEGGIVPRFREGGATGSWDNFAPSNMWGGTPGNTAIDPTAMQRALEAANVQAMKHTGFPLSPQEEARIIERFKQNPLAAQNGLAPRLPTPTAAPNPTDKRLAAGQQTAPQGGIAQLPAVPPAPKPAPQPMSTAGAATQGIAANIPMQANPMGGPPADIDPQAMLAAGRNAPVVDPFLAQRESLNAARTKAAQDEYTQLERDQAELGDVGKDREQRLKAKEGKLEGAEKENKALAIIDAGLAMMAGDSPFAMVNIGKGAMQGTRAYREGLKQIEDSREKLDDAFGRLEEARYNQKSGNMKDKREGQSKVNAAVTSGIEGLLSGAEKAWGVNREDARSALTAAVQLENSKRQSWTTLEATRMNNQTSRANAQTQAAAYAARGGNGTDTGWRDDQRRMDAHRTALAQVQKDAEAAEKAFAPLSMQKRMELYNQYLQLGLQTLNAMPQSGTAQLPVAPVGPSTEGFKVIR